MSNRLKTIQIFEFESLIVDREKDGILFKESHFNALVKFNELHQNNYFNIGYKKIIFKNYVGVLQIDGLIIEVLPKIDKYEEDKNKWKEVLIKMLKTTKKLKINPVGEALLKQQQIHLLDIYFEWFLNELDLLLHQGLIKQYRQNTDNVKALKGKLQFSHQISKNLIHKERFYTTHQVYDQDHVLHQILIKALNVVTTMSKGSYLYSKSKNMALQFPEVKEISISPSTFEKLPYNRKTAPYAKALSIARLILLNYAPDLSNGCENMLALLFDMNLLWEEYILEKLKQSYAENVFVTGQESKLFWQNTSIRPDIVVEIDKQKFILDTKWKNIENEEPSVQDLRQMYVYNEFWETQHSLLLYPGNQHTSNYNFKTFRNQKHHCAVGIISIFDENYNLDSEIGNKIIGLLQKEILQLQIPEVSKT